MITPSIQCHLSIRSIQIKLLNATFEDCMFDEIVFQMKKKEDN